jgi:uncharacterized protein (TIGR02594 family)
MKEFKWVAEARKYLGVHETPGAKHNPKIMELIDWADGTFDRKNLKNIHDDETAYCSSALSGIFEKVGIPSAKTAWARDWLKWGEKLPGPVYGAVVVFSRGSGGHVGLVVGKRTRSNTSNLLVLGFNQSDAVTIAEFSRDRVLGYRWPKGQPRPNFLLPLGAAALSTREN